jgi:phenylalanine-4-hydroxylase
MGELSEMAQIRNLHWWTEYGLIGTLDNPKIYGAGLSSISSVMTDEVKKFLIPLMQPTLILT